MDDFDVYVEGLGSTRMPSSNHITNFVVHTCALFNSYHELRC